MCGPAFFYPRLNEFDKFSAAVRRSSITLMEHTPPSSPGAHINMVIGRCVKVQLQLLTPVNWVSEGFLLALIESALDFKKEP